MFGNNVSLKGKRWKLKETCSDSVNKIKNHNNKSKRLSELLYLRGIDSFEVEDFLNPKIKNILKDPFHLMDMEVSVKRTVEAIENNDSIFIYGDYDVDGATSSSLLKNYFNNINISVKTYIPDRMKEGYGPNKKALEFISNQGAKLIIFVDCGTTNFDEISYAKSLGMDCIVIDHHASKDSLPDCVGVINPNRFDEISEYKYLCAAGVTYLFLIALQSRLKKYDFFSSKKIKPVNLLNFLDVVALGTVCDVVPLVGLNRCFVIQGLKVMENTDNIGIKSLVKSSGTSGKIKSYHLGFIIGPRINAGGRVGDSHLGTTLLTTKNIDEADEISKKLEILNNERRDIEDIALEEALNIIKSEGLENDSVIVVGNESWHPGIIGIVAGRIKETYSKPVCIIAFDKDGNGKGSGRSVNGVHLGNLMHEAKDLGIILNGGGHSMAAGFLIQNNRIEELRNFLCSKVSDEILFQSNVTSVDIFLDNYSNINMDILDDVEILEPYGMSHPSPKFVIDSVIIKSISIINNQHMRISFLDSNNMEFNSICFRCNGNSLGMGLLECKENKNKLQILGSIKRNEWNGKTTCQFQLDDALVMF